MSSLTGFLVGIAAAVPVAWLLHRYWLTRVIRAAARVGVERVQRVSTTHLERALANAGQRADGVVSALRSSADLLEQALDRLPHGVVIVDESGFAVTMNKAARSMAGTHHGDVLVLDVIRSLSEGARAGDFTHRTIELAGPPRRALLVRAIPFGESNMPGAVVVVVDDETERQRLEDVRTDFVANVSHELKTPIGAVALLAETLQDEDDPAVIKRLAATMQREAHRVGSLIQDLLELSRIELHEVSSTGSVALRRVLKESIDRVRDLASARGIRMETSDGLGRVVIPGDRRQLVSAVGNLLENAVRYSDPGSSVELSAVMKHDFVDIMVVDHGIGIPPTDVERVFERFYRVDRARSRDTGGTGLGLAIVRHVAGNHGGHILVESTEGVGSTFTLRLPSGQRLAGQLVAEAG